MCPPTKHDDSFRKWVQLISCASCGEVFQAHLKSRTTRDAPTFIHPQPSSIHIPSGNRFSAPTDIIHPPTAGAPRGCAPHPGIGSHQRTTSSTQRSSHRTRNCGWMMYRRRLVLAGPLAFPFFPSSEHRLPACALFFFRVRAWPPSIAAKRRPQKQPSTAYVITSL